MNSKTIIDKYSKDEKQHKGNYVYEFKNNYWQIFKRWKNTKHC